MTSRSYLLDTVAVVALLNGDQAIQFVITQADEVFLPITTIGELYFGAEKSSRVEENTQKIDQIVKQYVVLYCDLQTAYGQIELALRKKGRPIPQNDVWIAALSLQHSLMLITRDDHFNQVDGLNTRVW